jgi:hypothetical protein
MLGIKTKRTLVSGKFADEIREKIHRIQSKRLSKEDCEEIRKNRNMANKKHTLVWK